jgi:mono/diheme cytochrome c family protein
MQGWSGRLSEADADDLIAYMKSLWEPLLNFEWVMHDSGCRAVGVKGGRSPA